MFFCGLPQRFLLSNGGMGFDVARQLPLRFCRQVMSQAAGVDVSSFQPVQISIFHRFCCRAVVAAGLFLFIHHILEEMMGKSTGTRGKPWNWWLKRPGFPGRLPHQPSDIPSMTTLQLAHVILGLAIHHHLQHPSSHVIPIR